jgi:subtilisin family serine protease
MSLLVGLVDSGIDPAAGLPVAAVAGFAEPPALHPHGTAAARLIAAAAPAARLLDARVFGPRGLASAEAVAEALDWLIDEGAGLANLSLGLRQDRAALRESCARAVEAGLLLVSATPARGGAVYPAAYPGVLRITGDARCVPGEISRLGGDPADYGAAPLGPDGVPGGASFAAARFTGLLAEALALVPRDPLSRLAARVRYEGRERREG